MSITLEVGGQTNPTRASVAGLPLPGGSSLGDEPHFSCASAEVTGLSVLSGDHATHRAVIANKLLRFCQVVHSYHPGPLGLGTVSLSTSPLVHRPIIGVPDSSEFKGVNGGSIATSVPGYQVEMMGVEPMSSPETF